VKPRLEGGASRRRTGRAGRAGSLAINREPAQAARWPSPLCALAVPCVADERSEARQPRLQAPEL